MVPFEITLKSESLPWTLLTYATRFGNGEIVINCDQIQLRICIFDVFVRTT